MFTDPFSNVGLVLITFHKHVNDGIRKELCSLQYVKVDEVVGTILKLGHGTELAKIDIHNAYRIVPDDRHLLGMKWQGKL